MQDVNIKEQIKKFIVEHFPLAKSINDGGQLLGNGILDSLGILDVVGFLESHFRITITDDELIPDHFQSLDSLTAFVRAKQNGATQ